MAQVSERDLALLSALMYSEDVVKQKTGTTVAEVVDQLLKETEDDTLGDLKVYGDFSYIRYKYEDGEAKAAKEFRYVLNEIKNSEGLKGMIIVNPKKTMEQHRESPPQPL